MFPFPPFYLILPRIFYYLNVQLCKLSYLQGLADKKSEKNVILELLSCVLLDPKVRML